MSEGPSWLGFYASVKCAFMQVKQWNVSYSFICFQTCFECLHADKHTATVHYYSRYEFESGLARTKSNNGLWSS